MAHALVLVHGPTAGWPAELVDDEDLDDDQTNDDDPDDGAAGALVPA